MKQSEGTVLGEGCHLIESLPTGARTGEAQKVDALAVNDHI